MGNPKMPMLSRLGRSSMWPNTKAHTIKTQSYFQARSIQNLIITALLYEMNVNFLNKDFLFYANHGRKSYYAFLGLKNIYFEKTFIGWYPVLIESYLDVGYLVGATTAATSAFLFTPRVYFGTGFSLIHCYFLKRGRANKFARARFLFLAKPLLGAWSKMASGLISSTLVRRRSY